MARGEERETISREPRMEKLPFVHRMRMSLSHIRDNAIHDLAEEQPKRSELHLS